MGCGASSKPSSSDAAKYAPEPEPKPAIVTTKPATADEPKEKPAAETTGVQDQARKLLKELLAEKKCGPILIRLSWHDAGTWNASDKTGGAHACMRHQTGEAGFAANNGLDIARGLLQPICDQVKGKMTVADLWSLAAVVAVESMGGPVVPWRPGRRDAEPGEAVAEGRHPKAEGDAVHLREIFGRMGCTDKEIVALSGAHSVGRCRKERSGYDGAWTDDPQKFDNSYFKKLIEVHQAGKAAEGQLMLPSDLALMDDPVFAAQVRIYAESEETFSADFAAAFSKLQEFGMEAPGKCPFGASQAEKTSGAKGDAAKEVPFQFAVNLGVLTAQEDAHSVVFGGSEQDNVTPRIEVDLGLKLAAPA